MKCLRQPAFLDKRPAKISNLWELKLTPRLWQVVALQAKMRKCSYSTITRYCVFRLVEQQNLRLNTLLNRALDQVRQDNNHGQEKHRHMVCLYGDDEKLIRIAAMRLGITVSALMRLALWLYLPRIAMEKHSRKSVSEDSLFWRGIKRWAQIHCRALNTFAIPTLRTFTFTSFSPQSWWPRPGNGALLFPLAA